MLKYNAIQKLDITEPKQFIRKQFPNEQFRFSKGCAVDSKPIDAAVSTSLEERAAAKSYVDLAKILPANRPEK